MKFISNQNKSLILTLLNLIFFEVVVFFLASGDVLSSTNMGLLGLVDILLIFFSMLWFMTIRGKEKGWMNHLIPPLLINLSVTSFLFFSTSMWFSQVASLVGASLIFLSLYFLEKDSRRRYLVNASAFFAFFLFFASAYSLAIILPQFYYLAGVLAVVLSATFIYYKLSSMIDDRILVIFLVSLFALLIFEFFIVTISWPVSSPLLKSLALLVVYYLYWGTIEKSFTLNNMKKEVIRHMSVVLIVLFLILVSILIKSIL